MHPLLAGREGVTATQTALRLQIEGLSVEAISLDVISDESIARRRGAGGPHVRQTRHPGQKAGILPDDTSKARSGRELKRWRDTFETNLTGLIEVTQSFLPLRRGSPAGRIVNVSSAWVR